MKVIIRPELQNVKWFCHHATIFTFHLLPSSPQNGRDACHTWSRCLPPHYAHFSSQLVEAQQCCASACISHNMLQSPLLAHTGSSATQVYVSQLPLVALH